MQRVTAAIVAFLSIACCSTAFAQAPPACPLPATPIARNNLFSPAAEKELGRVLASQLEVEVDLITDPDLINPLRKVGDRLARSLPPGTPAPQWFLVESGQANAFTIPGARIYVTRKLITQTRSEDELASVLAHELGHVVARAPEASVGRLFRVVLKKTSVTDPAEVEGDYHKILDTYRSNPKVFSDTRDTERDDQRVADEFGVWLLARAGYDPQAFGAFFDRFAETGHHTGNWLTDFFGTTKPEARRLREIERVTGSIPANCIDRTPAASAAAFSAWEQEVIAYQYARQQSLHGVLWSRQLTPRLQADTEYVRFSPDGAYALVQTDSTIFVLKVNPFALRFTIRALDSYHAQFTPDSRQIVFYTSDLRVEKWDIASEERVSVHELYTRATCYGSALSPDGALLACIAVNPERFFPLRLLLLNAETGEEVFRKTNFYDPPVSDYFAIVTYLLKQQEENRPPFVSLRFSPDANYLVAVRGFSHTAVDLRTRQEIKLPSSISRLLGQDFDFVGPGRIFTENDISGRAAMMSFPGGEKLRNEIQLGNQRIEGVTRGDFALLRPIRNFKLGLLDLKKGRVIIGNRDGLFDMFDDLGITVTGSGAIELLSLSHDLKQVAAVNLPATELGTVRSATLAPDFSRLAVSGAALGAVWDLKSGKQVARVRGFRGSWFGENNSLFVLFPPEGYIPGVDKKPDPQDQKDKKGGADSWSRPFSIATVDLAALKVSQENELPPDIKPTQIGRYVVELHGVDKYTLGQGRILDVRDVHSPAVLWSRKMKSPPHATMSAGENLLAVLWSLESAEAKEQTGADPALKQRLHGMAKEGVYLVNIFDLHDGKVTAKFPIDTGKGSFRPRYLFVSGGRVLLGDSENRVLIYSRDGEPQAHLFGSYAIGSQDGNTLCVEDKPGHLEVLDASTLQKKSEFTFASWVVTARFSADGRQLGVVTADETFYALSTAGSSSEAAK